MPRKYYRLASVIQLTFGYFLLHSVETKADDLEKYYPAYAVAANSDVLSNSTCRRELNQFRFGIDRKIPWSLKVLDASGRPESGFVYGNNFWLGSKSECLDLENTEPLKLNPEFLKNISKYKNIDHEFPPFRLNYFIAHFHHNSTLQYHIGVLDQGSMLLGLCLPASCSTDQLGEILKKIFDSKILAIGNLYSTAYHFDNVRDTKSDYHWLLDWKIITTATALILTIILSIIGTLYDCIIYQKRLKLKRNSEFIADNTSVKSARLIEPNICGKILLCFSAHTNTKLICDPNVNENTVVCISGLRFLGMLWICLIHTYLFLNSILVNRVIPWRASEKFITQIISNGGFSVDTFFCISGFCISWSFFGKKKNEQCAAKSFFHFPLIKYFRLIFTRIIRLAPIYFLTIGIAEIMIGWHNKTSSFIPLLDPHDLCVNYWWRNMLYIHNFYPWKEMCLTWSWYMSNDMQFYIIGTFLLLLSDIYFYASAILLTALLVISAIAGGVISYLNGFSATSDQILIHSELYLPPWMRIGPYLIGMIAGYILTKCHGKLDLNRIYLCLVWTIGVLCNTSSLFGLYGGSLSLASAAVYVALSRIAWAVGISWILIACHTHNAGFINKILSLKIWIPLGRLTYCAYLFNPLLIILFAVTSELSMHLSLFQWAICSLGLISATLLISFIVNIVFAVPCFLLCQVIFGLRKNES